jgi:hypothetical protein
MLTLCLEFHHYLPLFLTTILLESQYVDAIGTTGHIDKQAAPIAASGDNIYIAWWTNKTGNDEVMFKASTDSGKTFSNKINLSNTPKSDSQDTQIAAAGNNVYITWWERNQTSNEPVFRVSNDNGKTFGDKIMLSKWYTIYNQNNIHAILSTGSSS